jgi:hypothetical protein
MQSIEDGGEMGKSVLAPRGYCSECGAALVDRGTTEVMPVAGKFDRKTGEPNQLLTWRTWECPNQEYVLHRGWIHTSHTDFEPTPASLVRRLLRHL